MTIRSIILTSIHAFARWPAVIVTEVADPRSVAFSMNQGVRQESARRPGSEEVGSLVLRHGFFSA